MRALILFAALAACAKPAPTPPISPTEQAQADYLSTVYRLTDKGLIDGSGFIVSRYDADGTAEHQGDSLIWSGVALAALPCAAAEPVATGLRDMVASLSGGLYRHPTLANKVSLDGAVGFYYGMADNIARCGGDWDSSAELIQTFADEHPGLINADSDAVLVPEFTFARDAALAMAGVRGKPHGSRLAVLEAQVVAWAKASKATKSACFRVHVGWLALRAAELAGYNLTPMGKAVMCSVTNGLDLPTIDHWCGRDGLLSYLESFEYNQWEYRHQRCPAWETPDGKPGLITPAIDRLAAFRAAYGFAEAP